jgi:hypothetical protein
LNGVFFVTPHVIAADGSTCTITNEPKAHGRKKLTQVKTPVPVASEHLYPLLRGEGVAQFKVTPDAETLYLLPQRGQHGDPNLATASPASAATFKYLSRYKAELADRSSYKKYQEGEPWWSIWKVGAYTFGTWKVCWREVKGDVGFCAAYIKDGVGPVVGAKEVMPNNKVYFVAVGTEDEAAYLTALLNAPLVASAVDAAASGLSVGSDFLKRLAPPRFDPTDADHAELASVGKAATARGKATQKELDRLDELAVAVLAD